MKKEEVGPFYSKDQDGKWWFTYGDDDPIEVKSPKVHLIQVFSVIAAFFIVTLGVFFS